MPLSAADLVALAERINLGLQDGHRGRMDVLDAATALLLMVGHIARTLDEGSPVEGHCDNLRQTREHLDAALTLLRGIEIVAQTAPQDDLDRILQEASDRSAAAGRRLLGQGA